MHQYATRFFGFAYKLLVNWGVNDTLASYVAVAFNIVLLGFLSYWIFRIFRYTLVRALVIVARYSSTRFDDLLVSNKTAKYVAHLIPLLFIYKMMPIILARFDYWENLFGKLVSIYIILLVLWITRTIFNALRDYLKFKPAYADKPIDSYIQVVMIVLWTFGVTAIIVLLFGISLNVFFGMIGAISAIILLIFRDTILGFVASIQVSVNDMVRIGDWITMDKFGADGDVIEINLATVKVRNFDNTTTTIPTYSLISDSFRNWRGMQSSAGRRIKRHILLKAGSIRFLSDAEIDSLRKIQLIAPYIDQRQADIRKYNTSHQIDKSLLINGRNMTNFGLFRKYITQYLNQYPGLNRDMHLMCRQLQPTPNGIPLEIYCFSSDKRWESYEYIMADIFDHIYASVGYFGLELYEVATQRVD